jgi:hypothetical protein
LSFDPERLAHKLWLGLVQPVGLVVSPPALIRAQVVPDGNVGALQQVLLAVTAPASRYDDADRVLRDFPRFAYEVLGWAREDLAGAPGGPPLPEALCVALPTYGETLRPDYVAIDGFAGGVPLLLIQQVPAGGLDKAPDDRGARWAASPHDRFERLLRDTGVAAGLLCDGAVVRLLYAPRGESSGHLDFPVAAMCTVAGRPLLAAMKMLLSEHRVFSAPDGQRLLDLLVESRKYQNEVSNRLAEQVTGALWELLRGFQAADEASGRRVLGDLPRTDPQQIYGGLLTVILRLVFLLYAEDQGLMPADPVYTRGYSVGGLFLRLRDDAGAHPDTMDQRFGAYAGLVTTFRLVFDGVRHGPLRLPARHGALFNPDAWPFLEGRPEGHGRVRGEAFDAPRVSDGVIWRVLSGLLVLDGERLSYRGLDVEQIGSVYQAMMGFDVCTLPGRAVALRPHGVVVDLDALLALAPGKRAASLKEQAGCDLSASQGQSLAAAGSVDDLVVALGKKLAPETPRALPPGALFLQPGEERRRSGSHYTPRALTGPIVRDTLTPVLAALGAHPKPKQILDLKVCDPAMGSGAFLVEACRQLADALLAAWERHGGAPALTPDESLLVHARRVVAQRCLYGVDKNPFAVHLAKLSLWLITLARDHAFSFLDHALKHGDALVGLTRSQIAAFHWTPKVRDYGTTLFLGVTTSLDEAQALRAGMHDQPTGDYDRRHFAWRASEEEVEGPRWVGDLCVAAWFAADKDKAREEQRLKYKDVADARPRGDRSEGDTILDELRGGDRPVVPLHWELEFPEVFNRANPGFDAIVGNPPFAGKNTIAAANRGPFLDWLKQVHAESHGNADLVAHFFRRAFSLVRGGGVFGLIATNTIGQGDTRSTGLRWICNNGGQIVSATRRVKWPGLAAVVVSVVHVRRGPWSGARVLDGRSVPFISAFLFHGGGHDDPFRLQANAGKSFQGSIVLGMGFTFDDTGRSGAATPIAEMHRLITKDPRNAEVIFPYIGGEEVNSSPTHSHHRYVINFGERSEAEARAWPDLMAIVEAKVKPERDRNNREIYRRNWWQFGEKRVELFRAVAGMERVLVTTLHSNHFVIRSWPTRAVFSHGLAVFSVGGRASFCVIQASPHETWARFFGSSMKDDLRYTPSDCFETFPFPDGWQTDATLEAAGEAYYTFRAALMVRNDEGLTKTYNRFHDPDERDPEVHRLRELHAAMDRAVLDAYGWSDVPTDCVFLADYEVEEGKKKPYRYRWPDEVRDEVLARLLALNQDRYAAEVAAGPGAAPPKKPAAKKNGTPKEKAPGPRRPPSLFDEPDR